MQPVSLYKLFLCIIIIFFNLIGLSCSHYSFSGTLLPSHIKTIGIPILENESLEYGLNEKLTNMLINAFTLDNNLRVVDEKDADSLLLGKIVYCKQEPFAYTTSEEIEKYKFIIEIKLTYKDVKNDKIFWESTESEFEIFTPEELEEEEQRNISLEKILEKLTPIIINKTVQGW